MMLEILDNWITKPNYTKRLVIQYPSILKTVYVCVGWPMFRWNLVLWWTSIAAVTHAI